MNLHFSELYMGIKRIKNRSQNFGKFYLPVVVIDYNGKRYEWRKMIDAVKALGRPLTDGEVE